MKTPILGSLLLFFGTCLLLARPVVETASARRTVSLDGTWQLAEGVSDHRPAQFERNVPVPGLVDQAMPAFEPAHFADRKRQPTAVSDAVWTNRAFWYRREFQLESAVPAVANLLVRKAAYGSTVYLNGTKVGESQAAFTASRYDVRAALRGQGAVNELVIRVGANRDALPRTVPRGQDYEKARYIPGLFDSVELELSGTPHFVEVQTAPDITNRQVRVQARVRNSGPARAGTLKFTVREAKSGKVAGQIETAYPRLADGAETTVDVRIPVAHCRLWSPEDSFLYTLEASTDADAFTTRFGMREFRFEPRQNDRPGRAYLNGKPYFMRGSNVTLYRFFEDPDRGDLPWSERWVRLLHRRFKEMHWNSLRYCIGFPPEAWYRIADEEGFLIQDEFPIWGDETGQLDSAILARQYSDWLRERWNHPCVVIWDAQNETRTDKTGAAYSQIRALDLSNRPWDNGYAETLAAGDVSEAHPYHFTEPSTTLAQAVSDPVGMPNFNGATNSENRHAYVINEYGWLWLNRNGTPTTLTSNLFARLAGKDAPPSKLYPLAARLLAADTEFWRCRRQAAAVMHFCALGYSRPDGQTSDHWLDVKQLRWEPEFYRYVRDAFAPVGLMVDFAQDKVLASAQPTRVPVVVINDLEKPWNGPVTLRIRRNGRLHAEMKRECRLEALGQAVVNFEATWPAEPGPCQLEAELRGADGKKVRSLRDTEIVEPGALGMASGKAPYVSPVHATASAVFPLHVSENGRHLVDASGHPFLVVGDTAWSLIAQLRPEDLARYLDDRKKRGFNSIMVSLIEHKYATKAPANIDGVRPFLRPDDLTQANPAYFDAAHRTIEMANQRGISVWLFPAYLGWGGGDEGFFKEIKAAGPAALRSYGRFVGERFKNLPNIVWVAGGDYALPEAERWAGNELAAGLRDGGAVQIMTAHGGQTSALDTFGNQPWLAVDTVYSYQPDLWRPLRANYERTPVRPFVLMETTYEGEHDATPAQVRRQAWWAMLSGACGQFFGNNPIWHFDGPGLFKTEVSWKQALDSTGSRDMARLGAFFSGQPWPQLVPDLNDKLVVAGRGQGATQITAAQTVDRRFALLYIPADGTGPRELTLNLASFAAPVMAHWFNPAKDATIIAHSSAIPNRDQQTLRTPGDNGTGTNDWVLVLRTF